MAIDPNTDPQAQRDRATQNYGGEANRKTDPANPDNPQDPTKIPDPNADAREQINELNDRAPGLGTLEDQANKGNLK